MSKENPLLPQWLKDSVPTPEPTPGVFHNPQSGTFSVKYGPVTLGEFDSIIDVYSFVHNDNRGIHFDETFIKYAKDNGMTAYEGMIFIPMPEGDSSYLFMEDDEQSMMDSLESEIESFINDEYAQYVKNHNGFIESFYFLNSHPIFWTRIVSPSGNKRRSLYIFDTQSGISKLFVYPEKSSDGKNRVVVEGGETSKEDDYRQTCSNPAMRVSRPTYEEAIIALAQVVNSMFNEYGEYREGAEDMMKELYDREYSELKERIEQLNQED